MIYCGIDPGLRSGAVGAIDHNGRYIGCFDIPADEKRINVCALSNMLSNLIDGEDAVFTVELVNPMPGQGSVSTGGFMRAAGAIEAVVMLKARPVFFVPPNVWKKKMGLTSEKADSLTMARLLFADPLAQSSLKRKKDNNRAEALLLASYQRELEYGEI